MEIWKSIVSKYTLNPNLISYDSPKLKHLPFNQVNRFKLNVQANAVCVDILVWATVDEGGEFVQSRLNTYFSLFLPSTFFELPTMSDTTPF